MQTAKSLRWSTRSGRSRRRRAQAEKEAGALDAFRRLPLPSVSCPFNVHIIIFIMFYAISFYCLTIDCVSLVRYWCFCEGLISVWILASEQRFEELRICQQKVHVHQLQRCSDRPSSMSSAHQAARTGRSILGGDGRWKELNKTSLLHTFTGEHAPAGQILNSYCKYPIACYCYCEFRQEMMARDSKV